MGRGKYQGVEAFVGMPGSGKTYGMAERGARALRQGREVWSNAGFDFGKVRNPDCRRCVPHLEVRGGRQVKVTDSGSPCECDWTPGCHVFRSFEELVDIPDSVTLLIDEAPLYFNARRWQEFPDGFLYRLTQVRKDGMQVYYSTIDWGMVDVNLRRMTFWVWECNAITGRWLRREKWAPEHRRKKDERRRAAEWVWVKDDVAQLYDTHGKVAVAASKQRALPNSSEVWTELGASSDQAAGADAKRGPATDDELERTAPRLPKDAPAVRLTIPHLAEPAG